MNDVIFSNQVNLISFFFRCFTVSFTISLLVVFTGTVTFNGCCNQQKIKVEDAVSHIFSNTLMSGSSNFSEKNKLMDVCFPNNLYIVCNYMFRLRGKASHRFITTESHHQEKQL